MSLIGHGHWRGIAASAVKTDLMSLRDNRRRCTIVVCYLIIVSNAVAERSVGLRRCLVRDAGGIGSANADMSSDKECEKHSRRKSKGSCARLIRAG